MQAELYDRVRAESKGAQYEGILMPSQTGKIILKLKSGYNIGLNPDSVSITLLEKWLKRKFKSRFPSIQEKKR